MSEFVEELLNSKDNIVEQLKLLKEHIMFQMETQESFTEKRKILIKASNLIEKDMER